MMTVSATSTLRLAVADLTQAKVTGRTTIALCWPAKFKNLYLWPPPYSPMPSILSSLLSAPRTWAQCSQPVSQRLARHLVTQSNL